MSNRPEKLHGTCTPVEQYCLVPATSKPVMLAQCWACGQPVCKNCSWETPDGRICSTCLQERNPKGELMLMTRLFRMSGYKNPTKCARNWIAERDGVQIPQASVSR